METRVAAEIPFSSQQKWCIKGWSLPLGTAVTAKTGVKKWSTGQGVKDSFSNLIL